MITSMLPMVSMKVPYGAWKDMGDVCGWFRDRVVKLAKERFLERGTLPPTVCVLGLDSKASGRIGRSHPQLVQYIIDVSPLGNTHEERDVLASVLPGFLREIRAFYVVTAMECWTVLGKDEAYLREWYRKHDSLRDHPDVQEAVTILWERSGESGAMMFPIERNGEQVTLKEDATPPGPPTSISGRFSNWLSDPPKGVH